MSGFAPPHNGAKPRVVASILEPDVPAMLAAARQIPTGCELIELRCDRLGAEATAELVGRCGRSVVVTLRRRGDGGHFEGSESERRAALVAALKAGAELIDVELDSSLLDLCREAPGRVIVSHHGDRCVAADLTRRYDALVATGAAWLKLVPQATSLSEALAVRDVLARATREGRRLACFALGRPGALTRLLAPAWGSWATYGAPGAGRETAEGQFAVNDLLEVYDVTHWNVSTPWYALLGSRVFGSPSPAMHRAGYREIGLDARYVPLEIDRLEELLDAVQRLQPTGLAVTLPLKEPVAARCQGLDAVAQGSGSVNTVRIEPGGWMGFNTDGPGAIEAIRQHLDPRKLRVAILGAGGTARAVGLTLVRGGARVTLYNRGAERARIAARDIGATAGEAPHPAPGSWDVLVQATPLGAAGELALPESSVDGQLVLDAVYAASPTPLVGLARQRGIAVIDGLELLARQGAAQFRRLTGRRASYATLHAAARQWLERRASGP